MGGTTPEDPTSCSIASGRQTVLEIRKGKTAVGIKIIGGTDSSGVSESLDYLVFIVYYKYILLITNIYIVIQFNSIQ